MIQLVHFKELADVFKINIDGYYIINYVEEQVQNIYRTEIRIRRTYPIENRTKDSICIVTQ